MTLLRLIVAVAWIGLGLGCGRVTPLMTDHEVTSTPADSGVADDGGNEEAGLVDTSVPPVLAPPPGTWVENWYEHNQVLDLIGYNDDVAIYFDKDVERAGTEWLLPFYTGAWRYAQSTYGDFKLRSNDGRYYAIFHQGKYPACHAIYYTDQRFGNRNGGDCGAGPWAMGNLERPFVESLYLTMGGVVEYTNNHAPPWVGRDVWRGNLSILIAYDILLALNRTDDAAVAFDQYITSTDVTPRNPTFWFRDWFYPLWRDHGHAQVVASFLKLLSQYFVPASSQTATQRAITIPEMVHFMSGAAGTNLKAQAVTAFGADIVTDAAFEKARLDFPQISY